MSNRIFQILLLLAIPSISIADVGIREVVMEAISSPEGRSEGFVSGPLADMIRGSINVPHAKVLASVKVIEKLHEEGCKRARIQLTTPGVILPTTDGKGHPLHLEVELNVCENGLPPPDRSS